VILRVQGQEAQHAAVYLNGRLQDDVFEVDTKAQTISRLCTWIDAAGRERLCVDAAGDVAIETCYGLIDVIDRRTGRPWERQ
jgi:hypothetical protein